MKIKKILEKLKKSKGFKIVVWIIIVGLPLLYFYWDQFFPPGPFVSTNKIVIPDLVDTFQEDISITNPHKEVYENVVIKFESVGNYKLSSSNFLIEPKEHLVLSEFNFGIMDSNFVLISDENKISYLKIKTLKANQKLDFRSNARNLDKKGAEIKITVDSNEEIKKMDATRIFLYLIENAIYEERCKMEEWPKGINGTGKRINSCFGGLNANFSSRKLDIISLDLWIYPEWSSEETNYIFDTGPENVKERVAIYRHEDFIVTKITDSEGYEHYFKEPANFIPGWNNIYFSLDSKNKNYRLYFNNELKTNYTFEKLYTQIPYMFYIGINSNENSSERNFGNFILDEVFQPKKTLTNEEVNTRYRMYK